jgi:hypothetical protein
MVLATQPLSCSVPGMENKDAPCTIKSVRYEALNSPLLITAAIWLHYPVTDGSSIVKTT